MFTNVVSNALPSYSQSYSDIVLHFVKLLPFIMFRHLQGFVGQCTFLSKYTFLLEGAIRHLNIYLRGQSATLTFL